MNSQEEVMKRFAENLLQEATRQKAVKEGVGGVVKKIVQNHPVTGMVKHAGQSVGHAAKAVGQMATLHPIKAAKSTAKAIGHSVAASPLGATIGSGVKYAKTGVKALRKK